MIAQILIVSSSAQVCCLPILIYYFGGFSLMGIATNLILPPLLGITMMSVLTTGIFGGIFALWTEALLGFHIQVVEWSASQNWLQIEYPKGDTKVFLIYMLISGLILLLRWRVKCDKIKLLKVEVMEESYGK